MNSSGIMLQIELPRSRRNASLMSKSPGWSLMDLNDSSLPDDVHSPSLDLNYDYTFPSFDHKMSSPTESAPMMKGDAFMDIETSHPLASMDYQSPSHFVLGALRPVGEDALQSLSKPKLEEFVLDRSPLDNVFQADEPKTEVVEPVKPLEPASLPIVSAAPAVPAPIQLPAMPPPEAKRPRRKAEPAKQQQQTYTKPVAAIFTATSAANPRDNEIVVGIYTRAERRAKILRYKQKRAKHVYIKGNQYECRRRFAVARPRVGGRFTKLKNLPEEESAAKPAATEEGGLEFAPSDD
jgi:hypothetical protein